MSFDTNLITKYQPVVFDPYGYGADYNVVVYSRIVEAKEERCIQYYYYWDRQDCPGSYLITEPNTTGALLGLIVAVIEPVAAKIIAVWFPQIYMLPWWMHFIASFVIASIFGYRNNDDVGGFFERISGFFVGRFFTHDYDFEPIYVFINGSQIKKVVISGRGDVDAQPHRNDIFVDQNSYSEGESLFTTSDFPYYPNGKRPASTAFKEFAMDKLIMTEDRPTFAIITCYHAFTSRKYYYGEEVFKKKLDALPHNLTDDVLSDWYQRKHFGHDVSDPFEFPYLRFAEPPRAPGAPQYGGRTYALGVLEALAMIMEGMIKLKNLVYRLIRRR